MGRKKRKSDSNDRLPHEYNLNFLTPDEKAFIKEVLEFGESRAPLVDIGDVKDAKQCYLEDRGYRKKDILVIAYWIERAIKHLHKAPNSEGEKMLLILHRIRQRFIDEGFIEDPEEKPPVTLSFLTLPERQLVIKSLDFFSQTIKDADLRNKSITARKHVLDDRDYTLRDITVMVLSLAMVRHFVNANVSFPEGEEMEPIERLLEDTERIKNKLKQEYKV